MGIESNIENRKSKLIILISLTGLRIFVAFFIYKVPFSANDDWGVLSQIGGIYGYGISSYAIPFMGVTITYPMAMISKTIGIFNVYGICMMLSLSASILVQQYLFWKEKCTNMAHALLFLIQCLLMLNFTFTTTAFSLIATGLMWGYVIDKSEKTPVWQFVCCIIFIFLGLSWRPSARFIIILFLPMIIERVTHGRKGYFLSLVIWTMVAYVIISKIDRATFNSTELSAYHLKYNSARSFFVDRPRIDYDKYNDIFLNAGWTQNIYNAFYGGFTSDKTYFSYDKLNEMRSQIGFFGAYQFNIVKILKMIIVNTLRVGSISVYFVAASSILITKLKNKKQRSIVIYSILTYLMPFVLFFMLLIRQRFIERVSMVFLCFGLMLLLLGKYDIFELNVLGRWLSDTFKRLFNGNNIFNEKTSVNSKTKRGIQILKLCPIFVLAVLVASYVVNYQKIRIDAKNYGAVKEVTEYMNDHDETLYVMCSGTEYKDYYNATQALGFTRDMFVKNLISTRGTQTFSEAYYEIMSNYDLTDEDNIFKSMVLDDNVYFVAPQGEKLDIYKSFMKDAYDMDVELTEVEHFDDENVIYSVNIKE